MSSDPQQDANIAVWKCVGSLPPYLSRQPRVAAPWNNQLGATLADIVSLSLRPLRWFACRMKKLGKRDTPVPGGCTAMSRDMWLMEN